MENKIQTHTEYRKKPINIDENDEYLFQHEYEYICQEPTIKNYNNVFFNTEGYVYVNFKPIVEELSINKNTGRNYIKNFIKCIFLHKKKIIDDVFFINDYWCDGYFHWNLDALPKLYFIIKNLELVNNKLIIPKHYLEINYIKESLQMLGYNEYNCIAVEYSKVHYCNTIFYCSPFTASGNYHSKIINELANHLKQRANVEKGQPTRLIYVSRKNATKRKISNESNIENILLKFGFEIIETENMSYIEQILLFNATKWLISIHGAALTNMLFMNNNMNILELRAENDAHNNCYFSLASTMSLNYYYLKCKRQEDSAEHIDNLYIEPQQLEKFLANKIT